MEDETQEVTDPSSDMDMVTVFEADGTTAEMEAMGIRAVLESNDIPAITVGTSCIPSLPFEVRVPKEDLDRALSAIAEAQAAGPAAAEEAERAGEQQT
jgi:hypothetical protein